MNSLSCSCIDPSFLSLHLRNNFISFHSRCIRSFHVFQSFLALALDKQARFGVYSSNYTCSAHFSHPIHPSVHPSIRPSIHPSVRPSVRSFHPTLIALIPLSQFTHSFPATGSVCSMPSLRLSLPPLLPSSLPAFVPSCLLSCESLHSAHANSFVRSFSPSNQPASQPTKQPGRHTGRRAVRESSSQFQIQSSIQPCRLACCIDSFFLSIIPSFSSMPIYSIPCFIHCFTHACSDSFLPPSIHPSVRPSIH